MGSETLQAKPRQHIIVIVEPHLQAVRLLRAAKRLAQANNCEWEALFVENNISDRHPHSEEYEVFFQLVTLAEQMGATVTRLNEKPSIEEAAYIYEKRKQQFEVVYVMLGKMRDHHWWHVLWPSFGDKLRRRLTQANFIEISLSEMLGRNFRALFRIKMEEVLYSLAAVAIAAGVVELLIYFFEQPGVTPQHRNKSVIFMTACAFAAGRYGLLAGIMAGIASFFTMSLLFISPNFSMLFAKPGDWLNFILFLAAAFIIALFGNRELKLKNQLLTRVKHFQNLLRLHRTTLNKKSADETIQILNAELTKYLGTEINFFLPIDPGRTLQTYLDKDLPFSAADQKALDVCW